MSELLHTESEQESKPKFTDLLKKYFAGDSHVHSVFSNKVVESDADYSLEQIFDYTKNEIDKGTGQAQFVILAEHSSDVANPVMVSGEKILERQQMIHDFNSEKIEGPKIINGVEANVISNDGRLDVSDEVSGKIELVIGSIHGLKPIFPEKGEQPPAPNVEELTEITLGLINNPNVDVIGHINRNIPYETVQQIDWESIFSKAKETNTAFEINLRAPMPGWLIKKAVKAGVPIFIGSDIHTLEQFQRLPEAVKSQIENHDDRLQFDPGYRYWIKIARVLKTLEELNCPPEQVITSSYERLNNWLSKEKSEREIEFENGTSNIRSIS